MQIPPVTSDESNPMVRLPWRTALLLATAVAVVTSGRTLVFLDARGETVPWWRVVTFGLAQWWYWGAAALLLWHRVQVLQLGWKAWPRTLLRLLPLALAISLSRSIILSLLGKVAFESPADVRPLSEWVSSYLLTQTPLDLMIYVGVVLAALLHLDRVRAAAREREQERLATQLVQAELRALRMQLQPHFLFNTLHAIRVLIDEQPARATRMVVLLGDLLRSTLLAEGAPLVPMSQELEFARRYLDIEQVRFEDRLQVHVDVPERLHDVMVPNFLLQPLVENAIHHGIGRIATPGCVRITARDAGPLLVIDVWNDGVLDMENTVTGVGLSSTRARLERLYGTCAHCELSAVDGGVQARVTLPRTEGTGDG